MTLIPALRLHKSDSVAVALRDLAPNDPAGPAGISVIENIPQDHKVALRALAAGEAVIKLGQVIGLASRPIQAGEHVHTHNLSYVPSPASHTPELQPTKVPDLSVTEPDHFMGILRANGQVGTRNYIGVLSTVNCSATVTRMIAAHFQRPEALAMFPNVDGVIALTHKSGCTGGETGEALNVLRRTIAGYARHPNFAAVLLIGLGCEDNQIKSLLQHEDLAPHAHLQPIVIQEAGGTKAAVRAGVEYIQSVLSHANQASRQSLPVSHLTLGLQCGGSDGFSAISANPALGFASDLLVAQGGTSILSETPEIYGAENLLLHRAAHAGVSRKLLGLLSWWEKYAAQNNETLNSNPTPGNKAGGITTILEKSLGAVAKGGHSPLMEVLEYAAPITQRGFVFMDSPGFDPVSITGQVASGANLICFTTGRGSCFGCRPAPSLKLATNTPMYQRLHEDMDLNCGQIIDGQKTIEEMGTEIYQRLIATASGCPTRSENLGYGEDEFAPWHMGATL